MIRRLCLFVLLPIAFGYGLALIAVTLGVRTAGVHWLATVANYIMFGLPGLAIVTRLGRGQQRDWIEMLGLLSAMVVGTALWTVLGYGRSFVVEADGPRSYSFLEAATLGVRDAALGTALAAIVLGFVLACANLLDGPLRKFRTRVG